MEKNVSAARPLTTCPYACGYCLREGLVGNLSALEQCFLEHENQFQGESHVERERRWQAGREAGRFVTANTPFEQRVHAWSLKQKKLSQHFQKVNLQKHRKIRHYAKYLNLKPEDLTAFYIKQNGCCALCDEPLQGKGHIDHIQPKSRGGENHIANYQVVCPKCNSRKGAKTQAEYAYYCAVDKWIKGVSYGL